ncbi:MAG TPA: hypothetical protein DD405_06980 [Desulfobacteraceae bacterium]|nr:hypothetical protein [Desulfobacteraceae bacterium]
MYFIELHFENAKKNRRGKFIINSGKGSIPKWTILSSENKNLELLQLIALSTASPKLTPHLDYTANDLICDTNNPIHLEFVIFHHPETEGDSKYEYLNVGSGIAISSNRSVETFSSRQCLYLPSTLSYRKARDSSNPAKHFLLAYGPRFIPHAKTDDFAFNNPFHFTTRFHTLFHANKKITDPLAFLELLQYRGVKYKKIPSLSIMKGLTRFLSTFLEIDTTPFFEPLSDLKQEWQQLKSWQQRMILPLIDICRHMYDAFPKNRNPLEGPGVILLHRPDLFCTPNRFSSWISHLDSLLPRIQFVTTLSKKGAKNFPKIISPKRLFFKYTESRKVVKKKRKEPRLPRKPVLLIDIDSTLPNLALMKLSRYYKEKGKDVILRRKKFFLKSADKVYASSIFNSNTSRSHIQALKKYYGNSMIIGGSGVDLNFRLPEKIENLPADYDLYPELEDRAIGFITRGCPHHCPFCVVPEKEGRPRKVSSIHSLLDKNRKKLILLDDNLLSHPDACHYLEEMASLNLKVNFTQTLDMRYVTKERAKLLRRINCMNTKFTRHNYYFSLNNNQRLSLIKNKYKMLGFSTRDNVEFVCMYGYNTTLTEDVERFRFLHSLPGAYVFTQKYQPIKQNEKPCFDSFFSNDADKLLDELIKIVFTQNMKSMENYYKWISKLYAKTYNKLHKGLVDTIFRYNNKYMKGRYIATLAGTGKW